MNLKNNKGLTLLSLMLTVIIILTITAAMIFNSKNQIQMKSIHNLSNDIETLNAKVDEYYLKYGELPSLCQYTYPDNQSLNFQGKTDFINSLEEKADARNARFNNESEPVNPNDSDEYIVIDLEKLGALTLTYGYDTEYKYIKSKKEVIEFDGDTVEDEIYVINAKTHQIYFPHGIFVDDIMYYTF